MIVLDTNVISELMRREPDPRVMAWIAEQPMAGVFTTTLTQAEIFYGLALLPEGRRRNDLLAAARPAVRYRSGTCLSRDRRRAETGWQANQPDRRADCRHRAVARRTAGDS